MTVHVISLRIHSESEFGIVPVGAGTHCGRDQCTTEAVFIRTLGGLVFAPLELDWGDHRQKMASRSVPAMMTVEDSIDSVLLSDCNLSPFGCVSSLNPACT